MSEEKKEDELYSKEERGIFGYETGAGKIFADPFKAHRLMRVALGGQDMDKLLDQFEAEETYEKQLEEIRKEQPNFPEDPQALARAIAQASMAQERLVQIADACLTFAPLDPRTGKGATEPVKVAALFELLNWVAGVKKNGGDPPTTSPVASPGPSGQGVVQPNPPTKPTSGSS